MQAGVTRKGEVTSLSGCRERGESGLNGACSSNGRLTDSADLIGIRSA